MVAGHAETPPAEVPEWRREVSERLESYRSRRERQRAANQSVLEFRVHSKGETVQTAPQPAAAAPAAMEAPAADSVALPPAPPEFAVAPAALDAAASVAASPAPSLPDTAESLRSYQPAGEADFTDDLTADITELASRVSSAADPAGAAVEAPAESATEVPAETFAGLPIAAEPGVVLADSATLEVHADAAELAEVQSVEPAVEPPAMEAAPLAAIPSIDTEYWHETPTLEEEEEECGSLTSGLDAPAAAPEVESAIAPVAELAHEEPAPQDEPEFIPAVEARSLDSSAETIPPVPDEEVPAAAALAESSALPGGMFPPAIEAADGEEANERRFALRTASRPLPGTATERIEIRVPQPVFDFSPNDVEIQPKVELQPVADLRERRCAAFLDVAFLGITVAGFFLAFHLAGGEIALSRSGAGVALMAAFLIYAQYVLLFTVVGGATPGMVLRGLRVVCFDGQAPVTTELAWRAFGYLLSAASGMLGFFWSAWDELGLTWHDRISQTYITYAEPDAVPAAATSH